MNYEKLFSLKNKTAIVTGGLGILGKAFCAALAGSGANVVVVDIDEKQSLDFAESLHQQFNIKASGIGCDVSSENAVQQMVEKVVDEFGSIDILHNNAATKTADLKKFFQPFEEYSLETWHEVMSVNVSGMFLVAKAVGKQMLTQAKGGSIIQTASIYGVSAPDNRIYEGSFYLDCQINTPAVYAVSKAAVIGLTKYLATYWADKGIRVNSITPGGIESGQNQTFVEKYAKRVPMNRMGKREEMVGALLYLASDASSYITGQNIIIDGGLTTW